MSGPKIDQAELERLRKAELERLHQDRIRKIREETEKLNIEISNTKSQISNIDKHLLSLIRNVENADEMTSTISKINELKTTCKAQLTKALAINVPTEPDGIFACTQKIADTTKSISETFASEVKSLEERLRDYDKQLEFQNTVASISKNFSDEAEKMKNIEYFDFTEKLDNVVHSDIETTVKERATEILSEIEGFVNSESIQESDLKDILAIANNIYKTAFDTNNFFKAANIEYKAMRSIIVKNMAIFDDIYKDYYAEYVVFLDLVNKGRSTPITITPKEKYNFASIEELQHEIELLTLESKATLEKNYIRLQIDDVMRLFGYNLSEEIVLDANQIGSHYICKDKSGSTAIHVHISDKKQIMMEIAGVGQSSGVSNNSSATGMIIDSSNLDDQEKDKLLSEQGIFCKLHPTIVNELRKRGVILTEKARKPVSLNYCKKIVSLTAGNEGQTVQSKLINEHASERKRSGGLKEKFRAVK